MTLSCRINLRLLSTDAYREQRIDDAVQGNCLQVFSVLTLRKIDSGPADGFSRAIYWRRVCWLGRSPDRYFVNAEGTLTTDHVKDKNAHQYRMNYNDTKHQLSSNRQS
jgi:hypothetical protein